jgi:hypothetical protein
LSQQMFYSHIKHAWNRTLERHTEQEGGMRKRSDLLSGVHRKTKCKNHQILRVYAYIGRRCSHQDLGWWLGNKEYTYIHNKTLALNSIYHNPSLPQFLKVC